jgi:hypothetical protein
MATGETDYDNAVQSLRTNGICHKCASVSPGTFFKRLYPPQPDVGKLLLAEVECPKCNRTWRRGPWRRTLGGERLAAAITPSPPAVRRFNSPFTHKGPVDLSQARVTSYHPDEKSTKATSLRDETFSFNNLRSSSTMIQTLTLRQHASLQVEVESQNATSTVGGGGITLGGLASFEARMLNDLRKRNSVESLDELTFEQTATINVPANTHVRTTIHWRVVWERGVAKVTASQQHLDVPYWLTRAIRFDTETVDVAPSDGGSPAS